MLLEEKMEEKKKVLQKLYFLFILGVFIIAPKGVFCRDKLPILILHSYDQENAWTECLSQSILSTFQKSDLQIDPFTEYMDSQRLLNQTINSSLQEQFFMKYFPFHLRVIISEGDEAFRFLVRFRNKVFPNTPVVFTGISDISLLKESSLRKSFTGIVKHIPYNKTIDAIIRFHPNLKKIIVIGDSSLISETNMNILLHIAQDKKQYINISFLMSYPIEKVCSILSEQNPQNTAILLASPLASSKEKMFLSTDESIKKLCFTGDFPIYSNLPEAIGKDGIIGGAIHSGERFGILAAKMALEIMHGKKPSEIPFNESEMAQWIFNYRELKKHAIPQEKLPAGSTIIKDPFKDIKDNFRLITINFVVIATLVTLILLLLFKIYRRRFINLKLIKEKKNLSGLMDGAPDGIVAIDEQGCIILANNGFRRMFGYTDEDIEGKEVGQIISQSSSSHKDNLSLVQKAISYPIKDVHRYRTKNNGITFPVSISGFPVLLSNNKKEAFLLFRDITHQKNQQNALAQRFHLETLLSTVSSRLVLSGPFDETIKSVLQEIGTRLGLLSCALYFPQENSSSFRLFHVWNSYVFQNSNLLKETITLDLTPEQQELFKRYEPIEVDIKDSKGCLFNVNIVPIDNGSSNATVLLLVQNKTSQPWHFIRYASSLKILAETLGEAFKRKKQQEILLQTIDRLRETFNSTISTIGNVIEMKDNSTYGHQNRVAQLSLAIAREMGLPDAVIEAVYNTALVHDLGKLYIPSEILTKPATLSPLEYDVVKQHPRFGYEVLRNVRFPWPVAEIVLQHHERLDGSGYPEGLKGKDILLEARILAVADVIEAMASPRSYRPAHTIEEALEEIKRGAGITFDSSVVNHCIDIFEKKKFTFYIDK